MAAQDYVTPTPNLLPGTTAKASDVNEKVDAINAGFDKLPAPRLDAKKGFSEQISIPAATMPDQATTLAQLQAVIDQIADFVNSEQLQEGLGDLNSSIQSQFNDLDNVVTPLVNAVNSLDSSVSALNDVTDETAITVNELENDVNELLGLINPYAKIKVIGASVYTFEAEDNGKILWFTSNSSVTVTFPGAALPFENYLQGIAIQAGDGVVSFVGGGGAAVVSSGNLLSTAQKFAPVSFFRFAEAGWWLGGERA